jgi:hypothetical protein
MTRNQFIQNTLPTIRHLVLENAIDENEPSRARTPTDSASNENGDRFPVPTLPSWPVETQVGRSSIDETGQVHSAGRSVEKTSRGAGGGGDTDPLNNEPGPLVMAPFQGSLQAWETQVELVLKRVYNSIAKERLPLFKVKAPGSRSLGGSSNLLSITGDMLRRTPSTLSKPTSEHSRSRAATEKGRSTGRWVAKRRSRPQLHPVSTVGSSRTSMDEGSSTWSPSMSSTWSRASGGKTLTSMSVDSLDSEGMQSEHQRSVGFANALSQAIIRDDKTGSHTAGGDDAGKAFLLEDESLKLSGAPWAKEGSLKHKHHLDGVGKRAKSRQWNDCFAVIEKGWMRLFSFAVNARSVRAKAKERAKSTNVVGGGNWMDSAEEVCRFLLRQTIASGLPEPGYSESRPHVWALSLPTGAVHLFQVGTADIVREFVTTANYWSARMSKEPKLGSVPEKEYGWSDAVINRALLASNDSRSSSTAPTDSGSRPSILSSLRRSVEQVSGTAPRTRQAGGDKLRLHEWSAPEQTLSASQLMEVDQLSKLQDYVQKVESELARHNELRPAMQLALPPRQPNTIKAMTNWENKSSYLLREIVKFKTYVDSLLLAQTEKEKVLRGRAGEVGGGSEEVKAEKQENVGSKVSEEGGENIRK